MINANYGWICPQCGTVYSPHVTSCLKCAQPITTNEPVWYQYDPCANCSNKNNANCNCTLKQGGTVTITTTPNWSYTFNTAKTLLNEKEPQC